MSKNSAKRRIKHLGTMLFVLYILLLIYFLFFSEEYGRVAAEERVYRYNLIPFVEIRRFWTYREQLGVFAVVTNLFGNVIGFSAAADFLSFCQDSDSASSWRRSSLLRRSDVSMWMI